MYEKRASEGERESRGREEGKKGNGYEEQSET